MLKVYFTGLIYFDGCNAAQKNAYAPDGTNDDPSHHASLWVVKDELDEKATAWFAGSTIPHQFAAHGLRGAGTVDVLEFRIPSSADLSFPAGTQPASCSDLDDGLPKLQKWQPDGTFSDFAINPAVARTIAVIPIDSGNIRPAMFQSIRVVEWTIDDNASFSITATLRNGGGSGTIVLNAPPKGEWAEVVFSNIHEVPEDDSPDLKVGYHVSIARHLDVDDSATMTCRAAKNKALPAKTDNQTLFHLSAVFHTEGDTPWCCHQ